MWRVDFALRRDDGHDVVYFFKIISAGRTVHCGMLFPSSYIQKTDVPNKKLNRKSSKPKREYFGRVNWHCKTSSGIFPQFLFSSLFTTHTHSSLSTNRREFRLHVHERVWLSYVGEKLKTLDDSSGLLFEEITWPASEAKQKLVWGEDWMRCSFCLLWRNCLWLFPFRLPLSMSPPPLWVISAEFKYLNVLKGYFSLLKVPTWW